MMRLSLLAVSTLFLANACLAIEPVLLEKDDRLPLYPYYAHGYIQGLHYAAAGTDVVACCLMIALAVTKRHQKAMRIAAAVAITASVVGPAIEGFIAARLDHIGMGDKWPIGAVANFGPAVAGVLAFLAVCVFIAASRSGRTEGAHSSGCSRGAGVSQLVQE